MKQLGARDFEDLLQVTFFDKSLRALLHFHIWFQCSLAAFEGLFPGEHDRRVQELLFAMSHWHALVKLRMHTDLSLEILDTWTTTLGERCRSFIEFTCSSFPTKELKREYEARKRREAAQVWKARPSNRRKPSSAELGSSSSASDARPVEAGPLTSLVGRSS